MFFFLFWYWVQRINVTKGMITLCHVHIYLITNLTRSINTMEKVNMHRTGREVLHKRASALMTLF